MPRTRTRLCSLGRELCLPGDGACSLPNCGGFVCAARNILKSEHVAMACSSSSCAAADCCLPTCGDVDDDGDVDSEPDDAFDCSNHQHHPSQMLKSAPLTISCPTGTCTTSVCCTAASPPAPPPVTSGATGATLMAATVAAVMVLY